MTAPTFIGVTAVPTDGAAAANAGPTVTVDKDAGALASAQAGDLIAVRVQYRGLADTSTNGQVVPNEYGGQHWNIERGVTGSAHHARWIWCRFNGTWTADPTFTHMVNGAASGSAALTAVALVFRPDNAADHWVVCNGPIRGTFTAGSSPFTKTITGLTPRKNDTVTLACFSTGDDNTWGSLSGTNWTQSGLDAQYRNTTGTDQSLAIAYQLQGTAAATNNVSLNQATLGGDAGLSEIITFAAITMPTGSNVTTVAHVQSDRTFNDSSGTTSVAVLGSPVTSGNAVIVGWNHETTAAAEVTSIVDNQSNEYVQLLRVNDMIFEQTNIIAWCPGITNGPTTITASLSTAEIFRHIYAHEVAGLGEFDTAIGFQSLCPDSFSAWNPATPSRTPSVNGCFLYGHAFMDGGANTHDCLDDADGWTLGFGGINGSPDEPNVSHYQIQGTATAEDYDIDVPSSIGATGVVMGWAAFKPATSSGVSGTLARTNANDTSAASGTTTVVGTLARTNANDTSAASGTTTVVGTLARTNANDTSAASGTTTVVGTLARTNANDTSAASGSPIVAGTLARTNADDTSAASGSVGSAVSGTLARTNANDTSAASGTTTVVGTLARTNAADTSSASGTTTVTGTLARTNAADTSAASGAVGSGVTGALARTNAADTSAATGWLTILGTLARTNANDTCVASSSENFTTDGRTRVGGAVSGANPGRIGRGGGVRKGRVGDPVT